MKLTKEVLLQLLQFAEKEMSGYCKTTISLVVGSLFWISCENNNHDIYINFKRSEIISNCLQCQFPKTVTKHGL